MTASFASGKICYAPEITARFRDPGGNVIGLHQQPARAGA